MERISEKIIRLMGPMPTSPYDITAKGHTCSYEAEIATAYKEAEIAATHFRSKGYNAEVSRNGLHITVSITISYIIK